MDMANIIEINIETIFTTQRKEYDKPCSKKIIRDEIKADSEREMIQYYLMSALK